MVEEILACPVCFRGLDFGRSFAKCKKCGKTYPFREKVFEFVDKSKEEFRYYEELQKKADPYNWNRLPEIARIGHELKEELVKRAFLGEEKKTVLDIGVGKNGTVFEGFDYAVLQDISVVALKEAMKKNPENCVFVASDKNLPLKSKSIDCVFAGEVLEHIEDTENFLKEIYRVMKKDSLLVLTTPNKKALFYRIFGFEYTKHKEHVSLQDYDSLKKILQKRFEVEKVYGINQSLLFHLDKLVLGPFAGFWSKRFLEKPWNATGLIALCRKK